MNKIINNYYTYNIPYIDIHGETSDTCHYIIEDFINDNIKLKKAKIIIIHGIGKGILKKETHLILKKNKKVKSYYLDPYNIGQTIIELNINN